MAVKIAKAPKAKNPEPKHDLFNQLFLVVIITTVTTIPFIFDSFTVSKLFVLAIGLTFISIRLYLDRGLSLTQKIPRSLTTLICLLLFSILVSWQISDVPLTRGLIGQFGRGNGVFYYFFVILVFAFSAKTFRAYSGHKMHKLLTLLSWFMAVYAALQRIGIDIAKLDTKGISPVVLTFGNSNFAGGMLSVLFAYQLTYLLVSRSYQAPQIALILSLLISSTFAAAVQGYFVILFSITIAITLILIKKYPSNRIRRSLVVAWGIGIVSVIMGVFGKFVFARVFDRGSFQIRVEYWKIAIEVIKDFPLFGVGPDRLYDISSNYMAPGTIEIVTKTRLDNAHNWYLNFGVSYGLISVFFLLSIFGWVLVASARLLKNLERNNAIALSSLVAFASSLLIGLVSLEQPGLGIWLYLFAGVVVGASLQTLDHGDDQNSISKSIPNRSHSLFRLTTISLSAILFLSSILLGNRLVLDGMLRSHVQTALLNKGTPKTFTSIEGVSVSLHSEPEYAAQALRPLAAVGDGVKLDSVSRAFYEYYPNSIQATLIRADVLRALNRASESCPLRTILIESVPWDFAQVSGSVECHLGGYIDPNLLENLKTASQYFSEIDRGAIPEDGNEALAISARLSTVSTYARTYFIIGKSQESQDLQSYGNFLLSRLINLWELNPDSLPEFKIDNFNKLLDFS